MDIYCNRCGEPWDMDHVMHEAEEGDFDRVGGDIRMCPACRNKSDKELDVPQEVKDKNYIRSELSYLLGDDIDGFAAMCEDFNLD